jgi:HlyD family secretion protein
VRDARSKVDTANLLLLQTELRAPIDGKVESLRVHAGQTVQAGEWVARVVRDETPRSLVAFVPERDAAFLRVGAFAHVEVDKLPAGEFGLAEARVVRVGSELAEPAEVAAALGDAAPKGVHVRVELALQDGPGTARVRPYLRPGTLVTARIALRDRRLLAIVFEPARKWLR